VKKSSQEFVIKNTLGGCESDVRSNHWFTTTQRIFDIPHGDGGESIEHSPRLLVRVVLWEVSHKGFLLRKAIGLQCLALVIVPGSIMSARHCNLDFMTYNEDPFLIGVGSRVLYDIHKTYSSVFPLHCLHNRVPKSYQEKDI